MGLRKKIFEYNLNDINKVQRAYLQKGICQPHDYNFPQRKIGNIYIDDLSQFGSRSMIIG